MPLLERSPGFQLHYALEGESTLPVLVLLNSLGADLTMWEPQMPALVPCFRVLRYDARGHGRSTLPASAEQGTLAALIGDVLALLDGLSIVQAHLCGISLGGLTAMALALEAPSRIGCLVLSHTAARIGTEEGWNQRIAAVKEGGMSAIAGTVPKGWTTQPFQQAHPDQFAEQRAMLLRCSATGYIRACEALRDSDLRLRVPGIRRPTLVISGTDDHATPPAQNRALADALPIAEFFAMPGAHLGNLEHPAIYNTELLRFLQQNSTEGGHA